MAEDIMTLNRAVKNGKLPRLQFIDLSRNESSIEEKIGNLISTCTNQYQSHRCLIFLSDDFLKRMGDIYERMNVVSSVDFATFPESAAARALGYVSDSESSSDCSDNGSLSDCSDSGSSLDYSLGHWLSRLVPWVLHIEVVL